VQSHDWRRYVAPVAFLAAVTIAVVLVRAGLESGGSTTTVATTTVLVKRYYRVHAGDTFAVIAHKTGVSVKTIERLNPKVKATSLHIGERIRIQ
jgi:LysM repeat protein